MTDLRQAAQQALEAMETNQYTVAELAPHKVVMKFNDAITALREALAQEHALHDLARLGQEIEQEPQAEPCIGKDPRCPCQDGDACHYKDCGGTKARPVPVAEPEQRKPLTDKQILADETLRYYFGQNGGAGPVSKQGRKVVDAIEAAHNIKD